MSDRTPAARPARSRRCELARPSPRRRGDRARRPAARPRRSTKCTATDLVTEVDRATERWLVDRLARRRPDDAVLGEEGGGRSGTSGVRWLLDPIDGTVNFVLGLPHYAVSVAAEVDGAVVAGAVANPVTGELFHAPSAAVRVPRRRAARRPAGRAAGAGRSSGPGSATTPPCASGRSAVAGAELLPGSPTCAGSARPPGTVLPRGRAARRLFRGRAQSLGLRRGWAGRDRGRLRGHRPARSAAVDGSMPPPARVAPAFFALLDGSAPTRHRLISSWARSSAARLGTARWCVDARSRHWRNAAAHRRRRGHAAVLRPRARPPLSRSRSRWRTSWAPGK